MNREIQKEQPLDGCNPRSDCATLIQQKARRLREESVRLDKLSHQLRCGNIHGEGEEALYRLLIEGGR